MIEIVDFEPHFISRILDLILSIQRSEFGIPVSIADQPDLLDIRLTYQQGNGGFWIALDSSRVVGILALLDIGYCQSALRKMFVAAEYRGPAHSVARRLLDAVMERCHKCNTREIYLGTTAKHLAAIRFYEKNGFIELARSELPNTFPVMTVYTKFYRFQCEPALSHQARATGDARR